MNRVRELVFNLLLVALLVLGSTTPGAGQALYFQGIPDGGDASRASLKGTPETAEGNVYLLLQFAGLATSERLEEIREGGMEFVRYVPDNAYIVRTGDAESAGKALPNADIRRFFPLGPSNRIDGALLEKGASAGDLDVAVTLWPGEASDRLFERVRDLGGLPLRNAPDPMQLVFFFRIPAGMVGGLATLPEIEWIEPIAQITTRNNVQGAAIESGTVSGRPFRAMGLLGEGQVVGHIDSLLDAGSIYFSDPSGVPPGPGHRKLLRHHGGGNTASHGTHTAGTIAGFRADGNPDHSGIAPLARLSHANYRTMIPLSDQDDPQNFTQLYGLLSQARNDGARVHSNSWGDEQNSGYTYLAAAADLFTFLHEDALVVFAATNQEELRSPENARNVLAVGAARRPPNLGDRHSGGVGPTFDGRRKPDLYAPGEMVLSAFPGNETLGTLSGTSMAAAGVSGAAVLVREYLMTGRYPTGEPQPAFAFSPSGVLLKAILANGSRDMEAVEDYPSPMQGWGRLQLDRVLSTGENDIRRLYVEDFRASMGGGLRTTDTHRVPVLVTSRSEPLRATLAWDDPPVSRGSESIVVNNLDLLVEGPGGETYFGNFFEDRRSVTGGGRDPLNNIEQVHLPGPPEGLYQIIVEAEFVEPLNAPQGFALAVSGGIETFHSAPVLAFAPDDIPEDRSAGIYLMMPGLEEPFVMVEISGESGDTESALLFETTNGVYEATVSFRIRPHHAGNGVLEGKSGEKFTARFLPPGLEEPVEAELVLRAAGTDGPSWTLF